MPREPPVTSAVFPERFVMFPFLLVCAGSVCLRVILGEVFFSRALRRCRDFSSLSRQLSTVHGKRRTVMYEALSDARKTIASASSSASARRFIGIRETISAFTAVALIGPRHGIRALEALASDHASIHWDGGTSHVRRICRSNKGDHMSDLLRCCQALDGYRRDERRFIFI